jgi:ABC-2 type transport system ATP-binding protein
MIGYMSQKFTLWDDMSIDENLRFTSELHKMSLQNFIHSRDQLLDMILFKNNTKTLVKDLPGGLKQQVSLVAALLHNPDIVFLDEPTAGVTPTNRFHFWNLIRKVTAQGKTVFVTTHYMDEAEQCDRIALMRTGEIVAMDSPSALKTLAFPKGILEIEATVQSSEKFELLQNLLKSGVFSMLKPHGLRFHAEVAKSKEWQNQKSNLDNFFQIKNINPSLEDVFIRMIEGSA